MSKEAGANSGSNVKSTKPINEDHTPHKEQYTNLNQKRDASNRSPLEGNPGKKQKENNQIEVDQTTEENSTQDTNPSEDENQDIDHPHQEDHSSLNNPLLQESKEIKQTLLNLNTKIKTSHQDLSTRMIDNKEMKELLTAQNDKIAMLYIENKDLKTQIIKFEKEALETQEEVL